MVTNFIYDQWQLTSLIAHSAMEQSYKIVGGNNDL